MAGLQAYAAAVETPKRERSLTLVISERDRRQAARTACPELPLRCVSTGYLGDGCSCRYDPDGGRRGRLARGARA